MKIANLHNKYIKILIPIVSFLLCLIILSFLYSLFAVDTSVVFEKPIIVDIPPGANTSTAAEILLYEGVLHHPILFKFIARITGLHKKIRAGRFRFYRPLSVWQVLKEITKGGSFDITITVPEGFTIFQIASLVSKKLDIDSVAFIAECRDTSLLAKFGIKSPSAEGFLFPNTYRIPMGISMDSVISIMFGEFRRRWENEYTSRAESLGMTIEEIVTLASIIEAEAHVECEQKIISSVYHNRLRKGMMLQADPTTIYGLRKFDRPLLLKDLDSDSPYNTYRNFGLPPGPICNPGIGAIEAALYPDSTDFLFFVSRGDGTHIFSKTIRQHHRAIQKIKNMLRQPS